MHKEMYNLTHKQDDNYDLVKITTKFCMDL